MFKKNDIIELTIEDMGVKGEGIGKVNGYTFFVKGALTGDQIDAKVMKINKNFGFARLLNVKKPSAHRVEPVCQVAGKCGGCQFQSLSYEEQLRFKENMVKNNLERIGKITDYLLHPIIGMEDPFRYRNKTQLPVGRNKEGQIVVGFYAARTHSIIDTSNCVIAPKVNETIISEIKKFLEDFKIEPYDELNHTGIVRHILIRNGFSTDEIMVCIVINSGKLPHSDELVERLKNIRGMTSISVNINKKNTNVIMGEEVRTLYGRDTITDYINDLKFNISPLSFYQVNSIQTKELYNITLEFAGLTGKETVWDLYCGIGTISLFLARRALKVYGVEIVSQAIDDARKNAKMNEIDNVEFIVGKSEEVFPEFYKTSEETPDVIVVDPPRKGCDEELLDAIVKAGPGRVVYVSCDSATLARDLKYLSEHGYWVHEVQPVDMFPGTVHTECICRLEKQ